MRKPTLGIRLYIQGCTSTQRPTMPTEGSEVCMPSHTCMETPRHAEPGMAIILKPYHTKFNTRMKIVLTLYFYDATAPSFANSPTLIVTPPGTPMCLPHLPHECIPDKVNPLQSKFCMLSNKQGGVLRLYSTAWQSCTCHIHKVSKISSQLIQDSIQLFIHC